MRVSFYAAAAVAWSSAMAVNIGMGELAEPMIAA